MNDSNINPEIEIDGKIYLFESLNDLSKTIVNDIAFVDSEISRHQASQRVLVASKETLISALRNQIANN